MITVRINESIETETRLINSFSKKLPRKKRGIINAVTKNTGTRVLLKYTVNSKSVNLAKIRV
jgi:hypothetical protein